MAAAKRQPLLKAQIAFVPQIRLGRTSKASLTASRSELDRLMNHTHKTTGKCHTLHTGAMHPTMSHVLVPSLDLLKKPREFRPITVNAKGIKTIQEAKPDKIKHFLQSILQTHPPTLAQSQVSSQFALPHGCRPLSDAFHLLRGIFS